MHSFDDAILAIDKLIDEQHAEFDRNEATTRLQAVDRLLIDVLGWEPSSILAEEPNDAGIVDYILGDPIRQGVVEAKREGIYFELPAGTRSGVMALASVASSDTSVSDAIDQVTGYCNATGIPVAVIANGHQLVAFIANRQDGVPPRDGQALVYASLEDIRADLRGLWDCLSSPGLAEGRLLRLLRAQNVPPPPDKPSSAINGFPRPQRRNQLQAELRLMGELLVEDIGTEDAFSEDFIRETYCRSGALSQYSLLAKEILESRYDRLAANELGVDVEGVKDPEAVIAGMNLDSLAASMSRRPIILVGDVGVGKSTFIRHLVEVDARDIFEKAISLKLDFGKQPSLSRDLNTYVARQIETQLKTRYDVDVFERQFVRGVYNLDLRRFEESLYSDLRETDMTKYREKEIEFLESLIADAGEHLQRSLQHIVKGRGQQVVLFLDNVDQRDPGFQDEVFLIAQSVAETWPVVVFVALRPETFFRSKDEGFLAAYQPRVFTISPPRLNEVIVKRLAYAEKQLVEGGRLESMPSGIALQSESLADYVAILRHGFEQGEQLNELIDNLSAGNVRRALEFLIAFIGSGHVNTDKILGIYRREGRYLIPRHEFLRAIMYGDYRDYPGALSPVTNLFDISTSEPTEHFLLPVFLSSVERLGKAEAQDGYVLLSQVYKRVAALGFSPPQLAYVTARAIEKRLVEAEPRFAEIAENTYLRVTAAGTYTARVLPGVFSYIDAIATDTPITDEFYGARLDPFATRISERLERAELLRVYLNSCWEQFSPTAQPSWSWPSMSARLEREIRYIDRRLEDGRQA